MLARTLGLVIALAAALPAASAESVGDVATRLRAFVEAQWAVSTDPEPVQRIGFNGTFWPDRGGAMALRCDSGPVGTVTYTSFVGDGVCAVYPYRTADGSLRAKVAVSAPNALIFDHDTEKEGGGLSKRDGSGVLLVSNPENETPEDRAANERSRAMAACQPADIEQAIACLDTHWSREVQQRFAALPADDVIQTHIGVGMWIRNNWGLWRGGALRDFFVAQNVSHPDSMSALVLNAYWLKAHGCKMDWNDTSAISASFELATRGEKCTAS